ncbi:MAG: hypothetical protein P4M01_03480 [Acidobacteriota bacterium]|nr:hypothetical protein [Acidobacteriota bacterium]
MNILIETGRTMSSNQNGKSNQDHKRQMRAAKKIMRKRSAALRALAGTKPDSQK